LDRGASEFQLPCPYSHLTGWYMDGPGMVFKRRDGAAMDLVRFVPLPEQGSPHARDKPVTNTLGIFAVAEKASAQGSLLDGAAGTHVFQGSSRPAESPSAPTRATCRLSPERDIVGLSSARLTPNHL